MCALRPHGAALRRISFSRKASDFTFPESEEDHRDTFDRMGRNQEFDASEMSGTEYIARLAAGHSPLVAIPVFPSRVFRHGFIYVNRRAGIRRSTKWYVQGIA